jgi:pimeloyl-ACP methyl ester carboxylesterase
MLPFFTKTGSGPALIILHGLFGLGDNWRSLALRYAERFTVYAVDMRNHGRSAHADVHDYPSMSEDVRELMDAEQLGEATIMGHSMGGKAAIQLACTRAERVRALVVSDIAPRAYPNNHEEVLLGLSALDLAAVSKREDADIALSRHIKDLGVRQFLLKSLYRDGEAFRWRFNLPVIVRDYPRIAAAVPEGGVPYAGPTLWVRGERSPYVQETDWERIGAWFPRYSSVTVAGAGHWIHAEKPDDYFRVTWDFLLRYGV